MGSPYAVAAIWIGLAFASALISILDVLQGDKTSWHDLRQPRQQTLDYLDGVDPLHDERQVLRDVHKVRPAGGQSCHLR